MFEDKCKELREELKEARDKIDSLEAMMVDLVPRAELNSSRKVKTHIHTINTFKKDFLSFPFQLLHFFFKQY
jgi:hypothetical protein